ncbi:ABC transporter ATP-binding protein [Vibrio diazotrophicus]|uniref:ABC transporter ATP-binding protein n=1 Tax=Vibrio diazotrophicus TaxID=685 RepID=UPI00142E84C4|nr:ABC transporter ATP-binding protein [Vibrio diazotrophicus]NIY94220.1 ABC transporter ATP-binding protein [Vibrio diazotrophicus]
MIAVIQQLWRLFTPEQKKKIKQLQMFILIISLFEVVTIGSVVGFMHTLSNLENVGESLFLGDLYKTLGRSQVLLITICAVSLVSLLTFNAIFSIISTKKINSVALDMGRQISVQLFSYYQNKDWLYHTQVNSSWIINRVLTESGRLTMSILLPCLMMAARGILIILIITTLVIYDPVVALSGAALFIFGYAIIFQFARPRLARNSIILSKYSQNRIKTLNEAFEGIKNVLLFDKQDYFSEKFDVSVRKIAQAQASNNTLSAAPKYMMEWMAYVSMSILVLFFIVIQEKDVAQVIPMLTLYGLCAFKLLPALQQSYSYLSQIRGNLTILKDIHNDVLSSSVEKKLNVSSDKVLFNRYIYLKNICFSYPNKIEKALDNFSVKIYKNQCVGFVGPSGAGKSTIIDILSGLIPIGSGKFFIDGIDIGRNLSSWKSNISYVPQSIVLTDSTIAENIAFGVPYQNIDMKKIEQVIKLAHLEELMEQLDDGIDTRVGERGVQLSGGQRQRIGIARALYTEANVLIFDEATSALDGITERLIMDAINELTGHKTIILIAHRLKTIQSCDQIFFIRDGSVVDQGKYHDLVERNVDFRKMANHS